MKGDFSRLTFNKKKHYRAVLMQQGKVQVDADWNEQQEIHRYSTETLSRDVIGICGAPKEGGGFKIDVSSDGTDLTISPGRIYVDGILCEVDEESTYTTQPDLPNLDEQLKNGKHLVYLDVWQRHITAINDPLIREKALGGPDTTTRLKTIWQVKVKYLGTGDWKSIWGDITAPSTGKMNARTRAGTTSGNSNGTSAGGYRRLENQLYRIEIHKAGKLGEATFKWSRDNGSVVTGIERLNGSQLTVSGSDMDGVLGFAPGQWVELIGDLQELHGKPGELVQIKAVDSATRTITLNTSPGTSPKALDKKWHPQVRRWDSAGELDVKQGWIKIDEGNLEVCFDREGYYNTGDYWLIPARAATGEIEWPPYEIPNKKPISQPPLGIQHHYYPLAIVSTQDKKHQVAEDLRQRGLFPPLNNIAASDVRLDKDNSLCELSGAETVQQAIDLLCQKPNECCTYNIAPGQDWERVLEKTGDGQDIHICFQAGTYSLENTLSLENKGNIKISGCGAGTRIKANAEAVLKFAKCRSVLIRDLYAESLLTVSQKSNPRDHLNGAITILDCGKVMLEGVTAHCAAGTARAAAGITVRETPRVRIHHCDIGIGHQQVGILLVNAERAQVEDNVLRATKGIKDLKSKLVPRGEYLAALRKQLISSVFVGQEAPSGGRTNTEVEFGGQKIFFKTSEPLVGKWQQVIDAKPPAKIKNAYDLIDYVKNKANEILLNEGIMKDERLKGEGFRKFTDWYKDMEKEQSIAVASQGIVCGGKLAGEVRIINNTIEGALQGIHIGVSHEEDRQGEPDMADKIYVTGNSIVVKLPVEVRRERHGIFVGNCHSLFVENNHVKVERLGSGNRRLIEGIRIFGHLGRLAIVRQNYLEHCSAGVFIKPLNIVNEDKTGYYQWLVADNLAVNARQPVKVPRLSEYMKISGNI